MNKKAATSTDIKQLNKNHVFRYIQNHGNVSRRDIQMDLNLSLPTTTLHINELMDDGLVQEAGTIGNTGGRSAMTYAAVNDARLAIGVDITRHNISLVAIDLQGNTLCSAEYRFPFTRDEIYYRYLGECVQSFIDSHQFDRNRILGVGIGLPGITTKDYRYVEFGETLGLTGVSLDEFSRYMDYPVRLLNDANAAGFCEVWTHDSPPNMFYILLSTFVGGAIIIDNKVYSGDNFRSGEVGHIVIHNNGRRCYCGQLGCSDAYLASTRLSDSAQGSLELFFQRLKAGDPAAQHLWNDYLQDLALVVKDVRMLFNCTIMLGGYVGKYMSDYIEQFRDLLKDYCTFDTNSDYVTACQYKGSAIAAGAALIFIDDFLKGIR